MGGEAGSIAWLKSTLDPSLTKKGKTAFFFFFLRTVCICMYSKYQLICWYNRQTLHAFQVIEQQFAVILFSFVEIIKPHNSCLANISALLPCPTRTEAKQECYDQPATVYWMAELVWDSNLTNSWIIKSYMLPLRRMGSCCLYLEHLNQCALWLQKSKSFYVWRKTT